MSDVISGLNAALEGRYRIEREHGEGGMATVYLAEDLRHRRRVALKVLKPELAAAVGSDRFLREIETTAGLRHPHIVPLYDSGDAAGRPYYVMPFVEGKSLRELLDREVRLSLDDALPIASQVADALGYAHGRGVVHRDVKPANILLEDGHAVVTDFGIAHAVTASGGEELTQTGAILGTPQYMSPEQVDGEGVDARSDQYSLACIAYEMLAGVPPFVAPTPLAMIARHALDPVPDLTAACPALAGAVAEVIERALAKAPAERYATMGEWRAELASRVAKPTTANVVEREQLPVAPSEKPSIAILPFRSLSSDAEQAFLADGIRLGIQASLVQLPGLFLVNPPVMNGFRGSDESAESVGQELGVRYVLEGAVQQVGQRLRVTVQLTDVREGRATWADRYDRLVDDVFEVQDEITREVITSLNIELLHKEVGRIWFASITNPRAREYLYKGVSLLYEGTRRANVGAREMFLKLYEVEPDHVFGPSNLAVTYWLEAFQGWSDSPEDSLEQARVWATKAMEYEHNNGIGHAICGHLRVLDREHDDALRVCEEAVGLRESCPLAHGLLGLVLNYCGDSQAAVREVREALALERVYPSWMLTILAAAYRDGGDVPTSIAAATESLRSNPSEADALLVLCSDYQLAGRDEDAARAAHELRERDPSFRLSAYAADLPYREVASVERIVGALREAGLPD